MRSWFGLVAVALLGGLVGCEQPSPIVLGQLGELTRDAGSDAADMDHLDDTRDDEPEATDRAESSTPRDAGPDEPDHSADDGDDSETEPHGDLPGADAHD